jgi:hypothetical protein
MSQKNVKKNIKFYEPSWPIPNLRARECSSMIGCLQTVWHKPPPPTGHFMTILTLPNLSRWEKGVHEKLRATKH